MRICHQTHYFTILTLLLLVKSQLLVAQVDSLQVRVYGKPKFVKANSIELLALDDDVVFKACTFIKPDTFVFQLFDLDNHPVKSIFPEIRYTNIRGGNYQLVYWTEKNGIPSTKKELKVHVKERITETKWFYPIVLFCLFILIAAVIYFWALYNIRQRLKLERVRSMIAKDLHDELGSDLGSIALSIGTLLRTHRVLAESLKVVNDMIQTEQIVKETAFSLKDTTWILEPANDTFDKLFEKIHAFSRRILSAANISLLYENEETTLNELKISMERRRDVYLIVKEAIHNIAKHAQATEGRIRVTREKEGVRVVISDNGIGFDVEEKTGEGNGLLNFQSRAAASFIKLDLQSTPSVGTTISMLIPEI
jgi:signal transduction histidine kinase